MDAPSAVVKFVFNAWPKEESICDDVRAAVASWIKSADTNRLKKMRST